MILFEHMSLGEGLLVSALGMGIVFLVLIALSLAIKVLSGSINLFAKSPVEAAPATALAAPVVASPVAVSATMIQAPGSPGEVDLYGVDPKTAAMVMAIVADEMQVPLNRLRFVSIREKKS